MQYCASGKLTFSDIIGISGLRQQGLKNSDTAGRLKISGQIIGVRSIRNTRVPKQTMIKAAANPLSPLFNGELQCSKLPSFTFRGGHCERLGFVTILRQQAVRITQNVAPDPLVGAPRRIRPFRIMIRNRIEVRTITA